MYASYIMRRTQIYLDAEQSITLGRLAKVRGVTASHLIREAVAQYLAGPDPEETELATQRAAIAEAAGTIARLPGGVDYVQALRAADAEREGELEDRWRSR